MLRRPIVHPFYRPHALEEGLALQGETGAVVVLRGRIHAAVAPLADGTRTVDEIVTAAKAARIEPAEAYYALALLEQKGYLVEADGLDDVERRRAAAYWRAAEADDDAPRRLAAAAVSVRAVGAADAAACEAALEAVGVRAAATGDLDVVVTDDYLRPELGEINEAALASGRRWLLAKTIGAELWLGPVFTPGDGPCWRCLERRLADNREVETYVALRSGHGAALAPAVSALPSTLALGAQMVATAAAHELAAPGPSRLHGALVTLDTRTWDSREHVLVRRPQCPVCGASQPEQRPVELRSRRTVFARDGGHRAALPEETLRRYGHHVSPITGVVTALERGHVGDEEGALVHCYVAGHNFAACVGDVDGFSRHLRTKSGGKGMTDVQARASALGEAIERYSGQLQPELDVQRTARYADLDGQAIHPHELLLFSERQYRIREEWNAHASRFTRVPWPFDEQAEIRWTPAWSLTRQEPRYLPTAFCYFRLGSGDDSVPAFCYACSNGNAGGNTLEEAVLQGFLELVERDAVALWWYNRLPKPGIDLASFDEPYFERLRERYRAGGQELWVLDITSDLGIPAAAALSATAGRMIMYGFGAHLDPRIAVSRALTELNQMMVAAGLFDPSGPGLEQSPLLDDAGARAWYETATVDNQPYVAPAPDRPVRRLDDFSAWESDDLLDDVEHCRRIVEEKGHEVLVLDQTRPDIGLPIVKVVVPGLRHFWPRFGPGRLYDVPVATGELAAAHTEDELNPHHIFI
jgi:ribosomal protein S12 methylthiotransferase accessory factor